MTGRPIGSSPRSSGELGMNLIEVEVVRDEATLRIVVPGGGSPLSRPGKRRLG